MFPCFPLKRYLGTAGVASEAGLSQIAYDDPCDSCGGLLLPLISESEFRRKFGGYQTAVLAEVRKSTKAEIFQNLIRRRGCSPRLGCGDLLSAPRACIGGNRSGALSRCGGWDTFGEC